MKCCSVLFLIALSLYLAGCNNQPDDVLTQPAATLAAEATYVKPESNQEVAKPTETFYLPLAPNSDQGSASRSTLPTEAPVETPRPTLTPVPSFPAYEGPTIDRKAIGVQIHLHDEDVPSIMEHLQALGVGWVKVQVSWKLFQPHPDGYSEERFAELDQLVEKAAARSILVLLSISKAPEWSRPTTELDGPPADYMLFGEFLGLMAGRYQGKVAAYELWNEPNLQREWNGYPLSAADLVRLTEIGAEAIRAIDPAATIISSAPAPTGINDGVAAIDDRIYLTRMLGAGIGEVVDAIGAHPYGWANPPESSVNNYAAGVPTHTDHPSFFFRDTLEDYHAIVDGFGLDMQIWVTEFGWGSFEGFSQPPPLGAEFMASVSEWQQAAYLGRAYALAQGWEWVGPMMLWNLNFGPLLGQEFSESGYSILGPDGGERPAYKALAAIPKK